MAHLRCRTASWIARVSSRGFGDCRGEHARRRQAPRRPRRGRCGAVAHLLYRAGGGARSGASNTKPYPRLRSELVRGGRHVAKRHDTRPYSHNVAKPQPCSHNVFGSRQRSVRMAPDLPRWLGGAESSGVWPFPRRLRVCYTIDNLVYSNSPVGESLLRFQSSKHWTRLFPAIPSAMDHQQGLWTVAVSTSSTSSQHQIVSHPGQQSAADIPGHPPATSKIGMQATTHGRRALRQ
jgi:hypothetical protein